MALRDRVFARREILPSFWLNRLAAFLSTAESPGFGITTPSLTTVAIEASAGTGLVAKAIQGKMRWIERTITTAHPGGSAGSYAVWVTAAEDEIDNTPAPNTDHTDYSFGLAISRSAPAADLVEQVATLEWNGTRITSVTMLRGVRTSELPTGTVMVGEMRMWTLPALPGGGWIWADGGPVEPTPFPAYYQALVDANYPYGRVGPYPAVIDMRGRVPLGVGTGAGLSARALGQAVGAETHRLLVSEMPSHRHTLANTPIISTGGITVIPSTGVLPVDQGSGPTIVNLTGGDGAHNNMQPSRGTHFIVKAA